MRICIFENEVISLLFMFSKKSRRMPCNDDIFPNRSIFEDNEAVQASFEKSETRITSHGKFIIPIDPSSVTALLIFFVPLWIANSKTSFEYNAFTV